MLNSALNSTQFSHLPNSTLFFQLRTKEYIIFWTLHQKAHYFSSQESFFEPLIHLIFRILIPKRELLRNRNQPRSDLVFGNYIWFGPIFKRLNKLDFVHSEKCLKKNNKKLVFNQNEICIHIKLHWSVHCFFVSQC